MKKKKRDGDCQSGSKNKAQLYGVYKKPIWNIKTHIDEK